MPGAGGSGGLLLALEAVQNAIKHAGGDARVTVALSRSLSGEIQFEVSDDGVGMTMPIRPAGIGLISMRDRIGAVGGELEITSTPGRGTSVRGTIPADRHRHEQPASGRSRMASAAPHRDLTDRDVIGRWRDPMNSASNPLLTRTPVPVRGVESLFVNCPRCGLGIQVRTRWLAPSIAQDVWRAPESQSVCSSHRCRPRRSTPREQRRLPTVQPKTTSLLGAPSVRSSSQSSSPASIRYEVSSVSVV